jgi:hypothetical protein
LEIGTVICFVPPIACATVKVTFCVVRSSKYASLLMISLLSDAKVLQGIAMT